VAGIFLFAQSKLAYDEYISKYSDIAVSEMHRSGVPASITLAQGLLESGAGNSLLASRGNNHFGIKCAGSWNGAKIYYDDDAKNECFRKYKNAEESFKDHSDFLRYSRRYQSLFELEITDYKGWAYGLKAAGYATDPGYAQKLVDIIEKYDLAQFDDIKKTSSKQETTSTTTTNKAEVPEIPVAPTILQQPTRSEFKFSLSRPVYEVNHVPFVYVIEGETIDSIAQDFDLFKKEILKFNDFGKNPQILPGQVIYLKAKNPKAIRGLEKHVVESDDETLWEISQHYAVKLSSLLKMNGMKEPRPLREGEVLFLR